MTTAQLSRLPTMFSTLSSAKVHALVPMKSLAQAKQRLGPVLDPPARRALALAMFRRVLDTLLACRINRAGCDSERSALHEVWVVSGDALVLDLAAKLGARALVDGAGELNLALEGAATSIAAAGADALLIVPADVPLLRRADVAGLLAALDDGADLVLAPDAAEMGTNALALRLPSQLRFAFGADSFARHLAAAAAAQLNARVYRSPTLALDIDTPASLALCGQLEMGSEK